VKGQDLRSNFERKALRGEVVQLGQRVLGTRVLGDDLDGLPWQLSQAIYVDSVYIVVGAEEACGLDIPRAQVMRLRLAEDASGGIAHFPNSKLTEKLTEGRVALLPMHFGELKALPDAPRPALTLEGERTAVSFEGDGRELEEIPDQDELDPTERGCVASDGPRDLL